MAGQVLDISKYETAIRIAAPPEHAGRTARLYRFPAPATASPLPNPPRQAQSFLRVHLAIELAIGVMFWLIWFIWHLMQH